MSSLQHEFDRSSVVRSIGGRAPIEDAPPGLLELLGGTRERANGILEALTAGSTDWQPLQRNYYFDFVSSREINAVAFSSQRNDFIGLNYGLWFALVASGAALFADPEFLPGIGDPIAPKGSGRGISRTGTCQRL